MTGFMVVLQRECMAYFSSPMIYFLLACFAITHGFFVLIPHVTTLASWQELGNISLIMPTLLMLFVPAVGMRSWAQERHTGSIELLLTLPIDPEAAVLGKFFAGLITIMLALAGTIPSVLMSTDVLFADLGRVFALYVGALLLGGCFLAVSMMISALTSTPWLAYVLTLIFLIICWFVVYIPYLIGDNAPVLMGVFSLVDGLFMAPRYARMHMGFWILSDFLFFILFLTCWLWACMIAVRRWVEE